jgi:ubiquinone/menaquinone biosynthesis C-methylase UbiE
MTSKPFLDAVLGRYADIASLMTLIAMAVLIAAAFCQGRRISIGRLSIGSRPASVRRAPGPPPGPPVTNCCATLTPGPTRRKVSKVFNVSQARQFYTAIAENYDERNSANLLATQLEVIACLEDARKTSPSLRVLDLGGGTGQNIATHFFSDPDISWTYVDFCPAMVEQLDSHLAGYPLYRNLHKVVSDIGDVHRCLQPASFDIVLLSLVLSSMPRLPDLAKLASMLAPSGALVISDINPGYTERHPYYAATARDGNLVAMRMRPVDPIHLCEQAAAAGLRRPRVSWQPGLAHPAGASTVAYSFVTSFAAPADSRHRVLRSAQESTAGQRSRFT